MYIGEGVNSERNRLWSSHCKEVREMFRKTTGKKMRDFFSSEQRLGIYMVFWSRNYKIIPPVRF